MTVSHEIQEFLGDNVPDNTDADPGRLTDIRSALSATHVLQSYTAGPGRHALHLQQDQRVPGQVLGQDSSNRGAGE